MAEILATLASGLLVINVRITRNFKIPTTSALQVWKVCNASERMRSR